MLDLARVRRGTSIVDGLNSCVEMAQLAEQCGYSRVWYAEHHNLPTVASSSPAVLIAHVAAHTSTIKLGAGGVMLPNHAPLVIAEQYGTLATLHPGRIELGLGRAPGSDQVTLRAMRRDHTSSDTFPSDVAELRQSAATMDKIVSMSSHIGAFPVVKISTLEFGTCAYFADVSTEVSFVAKYDTKSSDLKLSLCLPIAPLKAV